MAYRYNRINWQNKPNVATPISAENLNKMDKGIKDCDDAIGDLALLNTNNKTDLVSAINEQNNNLAGVINTRTLANGDFSSLVKPYLSNGGILKSFYVSNSVTGMPTKAYWNVLSFGQSVEHCTFLACKQGTADWATSVYISRMINGTLSDWKKVSVTD